MLPENKCIFYSVLNWGLGHATRSIPLLHDLIRRGSRLVISSSGAAGTLLRREFPDLDYREMKGFEFSDRAGHWQAFDLLSRLPQLRQAIKYEQLATETICKEIDADLIISDHRYGVFSKSIPSVFLAHQLIPEPPRGFAFLRNSLAAYPIKLLKPFSEIWVPDYPDFPGLSGRLSHDQLLTDLPVRYIGPLSRFSMHPRSTTNENKQVLFLISGPEPGRSNFEKLCITQAAAQDIKSILVCGRPAGTELVHSDHLTLYPHLPAPELKELIESSRYLICRPGYSTIMDLNYLNKKALFVLAPGQTEQNYLARMQQAESKAIVRPQNKFKLNQDLQDLENLLSGNQLL